MPYHTIDLAEIDPEMGIPGMGAFTAILRVATRAVATTTQVGGTALVAYVVVDSVARLIRHRNRWRNACIEDLQALNSDELLSMDPTLPPNATNLSERGNFVHSHDLPEDQQQARLAHNHFCALWARQAKARFHFASVCDDTALNRAALHRWLLAEWKKLNVPLLHISMYMDQTVDMAFEETTERHASMSKRKYRRWARMEYFNERQALSKIK